ncbi:MAG: type II toxin-antitoxin system VapC family toxin [Deltaproteobacteria bacterium]
MNESVQVVYWDASAILSALVEDNHTNLAQNWLKKRGAHVVSTLSCAEVLAVFERLRRSGMVSGKAVDRCLEGLERGPWHRLDLQPDWKDIRSLASKWSLRGADLWHLSTAVALRRETGPLTLLTFDKRLGQAAKEAGLAE